MYFVLQNKYIIANKKNVEKYKSKIESRNKLKIV